MTDWEQYLSKLWRPGIEDKRDPEGFICLNHNEAPFGEYKKYPDPYMLYVKAAELFHVGTENLLPSYGSEQGIRYCYDTFVPVGGKVIQTNPAFEMLEVFAYYRNAAVIKIDYNDFLQLDSKAIIKKIDERINLVVLANPDNPTGQVKTIPEIEEIAGNCKLHNVRFLLDEAYYDYYPLDTIPLLKKYPNLIIARSMSKNWGLAGARLGFLLSNEKNIHLLRKQKPMDELGTPQVEIFLRAIENPGIVRNNVAQVKKWQAVFEHTPLDKIEYIPTYGNFILLKSHSFTKHKNLFLENKILPRMDFKHPCLKNCIRFSIDNDEVMDKIVRLLKG
ncbi:MAG: histidinol-phosphate aminotransferase family protein [Spirochaetales bacterium]|nr:histidinol-phosphate aminotransferase family protein [Spirochaetales bacterium]